MPYSAEISRLNPTCFLFLVIQCMTVPSYSADCVNRIVDNLVQRCSRGMDIRDYFHIGLLGFTTGGFLGMGGIRNTYTLPGTTPERPFLLISQVAEAADIEEKRVKEVHGKGEAVEVTRRMPVWLRHRNGGLDPMRGMLEAMEPPLRKWVNQHPDSYPPVVVIICDGYANDGNPYPEAERIKALQTNDGNVLLFTVHLSNRNRTRPTMFPAKEDGLQSLGENVDDARMMFRMASVLPDSIRWAAADMGLAVDELSRGLVLNADAVALAQFLDIGTRGPSNLR